MKEVFVDTSYWLAVFRPRDHWAEAAKRAKSSLGNVILVTTDEVLTEFLTSMRETRGLRRAAADAVRAILDNSNVKVIPQSRDSFFQAPKRYREREDKQYSLVDCRSMVAMQDRSIQEALTCDHHFEQEGYTVLMKDQGPS